MQKHVIYFAITMIFRKFVTTLTDNLSNTNIKLKTIHVWHIKE